MAFKWLDYWDSVWIIRLSLVLPTVVLIVLIESNLHGGFVVPVPFLALIVCVGIAGAYGGQRAGLLAGSIATIFLGHAHLEQFGPATLTGGLLQTGIGSILYLAVGIVLGRLRDQRDVSIRSLRENKQILEAALRTETEEKDTQITRVAEGEAQLATAIRIADLGHFSFDTATGNCTFCSEQHANHLGMTPDEYCRRAAGSKAELSYIHADDRQIVIDAIAKINAGETQTFEYRALHPQGKIRYIREIEEPVFDEAGKVTANIGTSIDLTELREAEARVRQSQRIEAIGTLTGGVAHDFNNLLAITLGNLELSIDADQEDDRKRLIQNAIKATMRGADLTKNLLSFARRAHLEPKRLKLNKTIQNTMMWGGRVLPETISIENSLMAGLWDVDLDATSLENALINILLNARDAMPDGGKMTIETANMRIGEEYVSERNENIEPGRYVMLAISDTGHGILSDKIDQVFEPFYTDKPVGHGSGLGLSMVQGFIKQSGGAIRIYSEVGVGTTFKLYFRVSDQEIAKPEIDVRKRIDYSRSRVAILVVEDEEEVMYVLKRVLQGAGYWVTTADSGDEALEVFKSNGRFDLLLTDVVMPGKLQGPALAKAIRSIDPDLPCIFLSGYASEATVHGNGLKPSDIRLMKPASRSDLLSAISKALEPIGEIE
jgi:PAS domain S-box-containing protein